MNSSKTTPLVSLSQISLSQTTQITQQLSLSKISLPQISQITQQFNLSRFSLSQITQITQQFSLSKISLTQNTRIQMRLQMFNYRRIHRNMPHSQILIIAQLMQANYLRTRRFSHLWQVNLMPTKFPYIASQIPPGA